MQQFSAARLAYLKTRFQRTPGSVEALIQANQTVLDYPVLVPTDGCATWNLYYFCPEHGVRLEWDRASPTAHRCPVDGKVFRGEPWDGAWWRGLNGLNAKACYELGLLWQLTGETSYRDRVRLILMRYADNYPAYEVHGDIPCNGPGKANAQTLCEANCLLEWALGFDLIRDSISPADQRWITNHLLREGAQFLMSHRRDQLHNHEVKISCAVGVIGLILGDVELLQFAVNSRYGLRYQLKHGVLADGLWYEGSLHYHYYALQGFLQFERLAEETCWSLVNDPNLQAMLRFPLQLVDADGNLPRLNDCIAGQERLAHTDLYEYAWARFGDPLYARALQTAYAGQPRIQRDALIYGTETLPSGSLSAAKDVHAPAAGITRWQQAGQTLLLHYSPFGGEHDHMARGHLSLWRNGREILPDLGTTGYGAPLHYGYYKHTASHNTLSINGSNQPPVTPQLLGHGQHGKVRWLDLLLDWTQPVELPASHWLTAWDSELWRGIGFRRRVLLLPDALIEINDLVNPEAQMLTLNWHLRGQCMSDPLIPAPAPFDTAPYDQVHDWWQHPLQGIQQLDYAMDEAPFRLFIAGQGMLYGGRGPDNPATEKLDWLVWCSPATKARLMVVHDLDPLHPLQAIKYEEQGDQLSLLLRRQQGVQRLRLPLAEEAALAIQLDSVS